MDRLKEYGQSVDPEIMDMLVAVAVTHVADNVSEEYLVETLPDMLALLTEEGLIATVAFPTRMDIPAVLDEAGVQAALKKSAADLLCDATGVDGIQFVGGDDGGGDRN